MNALQLIFKLVPVIISFIHAAEAAFPGSGTGKQKLDAVVGAVSSILDAAPGALTQAQAIKAALKPSVDLLVSAFNAMGIFKKPGAAAAPSAAVTQIVPAPPAPAA